jgi:hypothetical protein
MKETTDYPAGDDAADIPLIDWQLLSARDHAAVHQRAGGCARVRQGDRISPRSFGETHTPWSCPLVHPPFGLCLP